MDVTMSTSTYIIPCFHPILPSFILICLPLLSCPVCLSCLPLIPLLFLLELYRILSVPSHPILPSFISPACLSSPVCPVLSPSYPPLILIRAVSDTQCAFSSNTSLLYLSCLSLISCPLLSVLSCLSCRVSLLSPSYSY